MTRTIEITGAGLAGTLRLTWARDNLAHVLEHAGTAEPAGTWTGLACPGVGTETLIRMSVHDEIADLIWEAPDHIAGPHNQAFQSAMRAYEAGNAHDAERYWQDLAAIWSHAWAANWATLGYMQKVGLTRVSPVKPQRWVVASFEHRCGPHGIQHPHVHNIVIAELTSGT